MFGLLEHANPANRVIAILVAMALVLMSVGFTSIGSARAANVLEFSDLLTDSAPGVGSNHTITFRAPTEDIDGVETIVLTFPTSPDSFDLSTIGQEDIDLLEDGVNQAAAGWSVATSATQITITMAGETIASSATTTIIIGTNATNEGSPDSQIINPATSNTSYEITVTAGPSDIGATRVAIVDTVTVSATVDTEFTFTITGLATSSAVNGTSTTGSTTATVVNFGDLDAWEIETLAQRLNVQTNARNGYVVTVETDQQLSSETGADIDSFADGGDDDSPVVWALPSNTILQENTYGHWGITTTDGNLQGLGTAFTVADTWIAASTSPRAVMAHDGPSDGTSGTGDATGDDVGSTTIGYQIQITPLQEAADDYSAILTYIATPTF